MKKSLLAVAVLFVAQLTMAQSDSLKWLDIELAYYPYPYEVSTLALQVQKQELKMAYMDVRPDNYNGKTSF